MKAEMKIFWILFCFGVLWLIAPLFYDLASLTHKYMHENMPASSCKPAPGKCAFDGYGVYCMLPHDRAPLRHGEQK